MDETVLNTIMNLEAEFTPNPVPLESRVKLDDPFLYAFELLQQIKQDERDASIRKALRLCSEERHYSHNITTLLYYSLYYLNNYKDDARVRWDFHSRLTLDVEQLLTNTRSFLDSIYKLALMFSNQEMSVPGTRRNSFGKFAVWAKENKDKSFEPPLSFLYELVPWGLTIRRVRDDYVHRGTEAEPFLGSDEVYFYPYLFDRNISPMPGLFYPTDSPLFSTTPLKPIYLRKFVLYTVAPIIAIELVLGRYLADLFRARYGPLPTFECSFRFDANIEALHHLVLQNKDCLAGDIYMSTYFT